MAYLSESDLTRRAATHPHVRNIAASRAQSKLSVFLSHSHADRALVQHFIGELDNAGIAIYVDWHDSTMPRVTSRVTAETIKTAIKTNRLFMVLATSRALTSRWVPWEIGVADQIHPSDDIVVVPVADPTGRFEGNEYLQLYNHVEIINGTLRVLRPNQSVAFTDLSAYLKARSATLFG